MGRYKAFTDCRIMNHRRQTIWMMMICLTVSMEGTSATLAYKGNIGVINSAAEIYKDEMQSGESKCNPAIESHRNSLNCFDYHLTSRNTYETQFIVSCKIMLDKDYHTKLFSHIIILMDLTHAKWSLINQKKQLYTHPLGWTPNDFILFDKKVVHGKYNDMRINRYSGQLYNEVVKYGNYQVDTGKCVSSALLYK